MILHPGILALLVGSCIVFVMMLFASVQDQVGELGFRTALKNSQPRRKDLSDLIYHQICLS
jgi:hypothetical protein